MYGRLCGLLLLLTHLRQVCPHQRLSEWRWYRIAAARNLLVFRVLLPPIVLVDDVPLWEALRLASACRCTCCKPGWLRIINPAPAQRVSLADISGDTVTTTQSAQESSVNIDSLADDFRERIDAAQDVDSAKALRADIESAKVTLGSALFTELKNKAVKRYYLVDSRNKVEAAINSLPSPDEPGAAERFAEVERVLATNKRHMGDELHDQFSITLADMKPEYVG